MPKRVKEKNSVQVQCMAKPNSPAVVVLSNAYDHFFDQVLPSSDVQNPPIPIRGI